jgi:hypothetical protein
LTVHVELFPSRSENDFDEGRYVQWRDHCTQGSFGAQFDPFLRVPDGLRTYRLTHRAYVHNYIVIIIVLKQRT